MDHIISNVKDCVNLTLLIGSKAETLIKLKKMGFNVPDFFVISSDIKDYNNIEKEINIAFDKLGSSLVAVRSSAVGEDGVTKSFAGQYKTLLSVSKESLIDSVIECVGSLSNKHALSYSQDRPIDKMSVIIQEMIFPDISGVSFSADPVRSDKNVIIIESVEGPCESLVSGIVTPNHYAINKDGLDNEYINNDIKSVVDITKKIESCLGYFVDIEWAIKDGVLYILQARPITTLK